VSVAPSRNPATGVRPDDGPDLSLRDPSTPAPSTPAPRRAEATQPERSRARRVLDALAPYLLTLAVGLPFAGLALWLLRQPKVQLGTPWALTTLVAVPLCAWGAFHLEGRRSPTMLFSRTRAASQARPAQGAMGYLLHLPAALRIVAIALVALGLARPQRETADRAEVEGIDIVVALDLSNSMSEVDLTPDRLTAAKRVLVDFIKRRQGDRIGLVVFGRSAYTYVPLTLDTISLRKRVEELELNMGIDGSGTAIGEALGVAVNRLREPSCDKKIGDEKRRCEERAKETRARSKVVVLVTDGENNAGTLDPHEAARLAQAMNVKVYTVLIGRDVLGGPPEPAARDRFGAVVFGGRPRYPVNPKLLEEIAGQTGGLPFLATDARALEERFQRVLEDLDKSKLKSMRPRYAELSPWFLWPALGLVLLEILLSLTRWRRFP
jgi:Ca-activated chloride channel family protein